MPDVRAGRAFLAAVLLLAVFLLFPGLVTAAPVEEGGAASRAYGISGSPAPEQEENVPLIWEEAPAGGAGRLQIEWKKEVAVAADDTVDFVSPEEAYAKYKAQEARSTWSLRAGFYLLALPVLGISVGALLYYRGRSRRA